MSQRSDWLPASREGVLTMARTWISVAGGHAEAWDIPATLFTTFTDLAMAAEAALQFAKEESSRIAGGFCGSLFGFFRPVKAA